MKEQFVTNKKYFNFSTEGKCGVIVDEKTMRRILEVLYRAEAEIKTMLHNSEGVRPYSWGIATLKNADKIISAKIYHYAEYHKSDDVKDRINNLKLPTPEYLENFYEIKSEEEEENLKTDLIEELITEQKAKEGK